MKPFFTIAALGLSAAAISSFAVDPSGTLNNVGQGFGTVFQWGADIVTPAIA